MTARAVTRVYDEALRPIGLKITQFALLSAIDMGIGGSISDLAERLAFERTTLTRNLQLLKDNGFIVPREGTGRAVAYAMTPKGQIKATPFRSGEKPRPGSRRGSGRHNGKPPAIICGRCAERHCRPPDRP